MSEPLNIALIASESVPYAKSGGLADVVGALPKELAQTGQRVIVILPLYSSIDREKFSLRPFLSPLGVWMGNAEEWCAVYSAENKGIPYYFIEFKQILRSPPSLPRR